MKELLIEKYEKPTEIDDEGTKIWKNRFGEIHRGNDKPAIIYKDGWKKYYKNGKEYQPIKTFEDACKRVKTDQKTLKIISILYENGQKSEGAYCKLVIIVRALNQGWTPDWDDTNQLKWYPWFHVGSGFGFSYSGYCFSLSDANFGSRLCFKNEELAEYAGRQFENLYREYLTIEDKK